MRRPLLCADGPHNLSGAFLAVWRRYGGLDTFGYPRTEPFTESGDLAQYTDIASGCANSIPWGAQVATSVSTAGERTPRWVWWTMGLECPGYHMLY